MKIVIAPDSFKECLWAQEVAAALGEGVLEACPDAAIDLCPMADGGEGTVEAMVAATGGAFAYADVFDPLGRPIRARFGLLGRASQANLPGEVGLAAALAGDGGNVPAPEEGLTAVIEMAAASGLRLVPPDKRNPLRATTFGTGQLVLAALDAGARQIVLGIGGSATTDGGCGAAQAMGVTFVGRDGKAVMCGMGGGAIADVADFGTSGLDPRVRLARIRVACDVTNPLTGPNGSAAVYGPQKGATAEMVAQLDANLAHLAELIRRKLGLEVESMPGAGAAGGLGAGLVAFAGAKIERGVQVVADAVGLRRRLAGADLCITGEGRLDAQSRSGKTVYGVAALAGELGVPVVCIPGQALDGPSHEIFERVLPLVDGDVTVRQAMAQPAMLLRLRARQAMYARRGG
jgi:glycerate kinase